MEYNSETVLKFKNAYLEKIKNFSDKSLIITDKMPQNFLYIGLIATSFPEAKILQIKRDKAAVCWANYKQWFKSKDLSYSYSINDIIKYYELYEDLMNFWKKFFNNRIYEVNYESLTNNHENEIKKLIKYLNLDWEESCLSPHKNSRAVMTASSLQVRKKIYKGSSKDWQKFQPFLSNTLDNIDK